MKKILVLISLLAAISSFANITYNIDDVDAVFSNGKIISVEDLRDGFATIQGVHVNEETLIISDKSKALILLRNSTSNKLLRFTTMASVKSGGDGGGG